MLSLKQRVIHELMASSGSAPTSTIARAPRFASLAALTGQLKLADVLRLSGDSQLSERALTKITASLGELKGVTMKLGQILSYADTSLPDEARAALAALQTHSRPLPRWKVHALIRTELGPESAPLLRALEDAPLAAASLGQVHRSRVPGGTQVVVKVQYPGIEDIIRSDFGPAAVGSMLASFLYGGAGAERFIAEARTRFLRECDYLHEARCQTRFAELFTEHPTLIIPKVHAPYSNGRVLTSTYVEGDHLDAYLARGPSQDERDRVGTALFEFYLGSLFRHGTYNCDPHPGNYLFTGDGRVAILDHGCAESFDERFVSQLANLTEAASDDDDARLHDALVDLGMVKPRTDYDPKKMRQVVRSFYGPMLRDDVLVFDDRDTLEMRGVTSRRELLRDGVPGELLFLLRVRIGLAAVLSRIGARANWCALERQYIAEHLRRIDERENPREFDLVLHDVGMAPIQVVRELRDALSLGLVEARALADDAPTTLCARISEKQAGALRERLAAAGAVAEVVRTGALQRDKPVIIVNDVAKDRRRRGYARRR